MAVARVAILRRKAPVDTARGDPWSDQLDETGSDTGDGPGDATDPTKPKLPAVPAAASDATAVAKRGPAFAPQSQPTIGAQPLVKDRAMRGPLGALFGIGEGVHNKIAQVLQGGYSAPEAARDVVTSSGLPDIATGLLKGDLGRLALGAFSLGTLGEGGAAGRAAEAQAAEDVVRSLASRVGEGEAMGPVIAGAERLPEQRDLPRWRGPRTTQQQLDDVHEEALKTYGSPAFERLITTGGTPDFYHTYGILQKATDALGDVEGPKAYRDLMNKMGATTAMSIPDNNLRRAQYYRGLDMAGLLDPEALRAGMYKTVPKGMGHIANDAHALALARDVETGMVDPIINPKPASFVENNLMNFRPLTNDTRMATGTALINPRMVELGALVKKKGDTYGPRDWAYSPMERAFQTKADEWAGRGMLNPLPGGSPTAYGQAKAWDALASILPDASPNAGTMDDIFNQKLAENARNWGKSLGETNQLIWQGHPFDIPLNTDVIPRGLIRQPRSGLYVPNRSNPSGLILPGGY